NAGSILIPAWAPGTPPWSPQKPGDSMPAITVKASKRDNREARLQKLTPAQNAAPEPDDAMRQRIAEAAYYRAEKRGFQPGCEIEDWVKAEAEIGSRLASKL